MPMRAFGPLPVFLMLLLAVVVSSTAAFAGTTAFQLQAVQVPTPGCEFLADFNCSLVASAGSFSVNETGDILNPTTLQFGAPLNQTCYPLNGTAVLDLGGGDSLALRSDAAADTICISQPIDSQGVGAPPLGPWPLTLTVSVDSIASTGQYAGATGAGTLNGTWIPTTSCLDSQGQPIHDCGFSGEELSFTLTDISVPDLTLVSGGCVNDCNGGGGGPNGGDTPELDSLVLMASGLASLGAYLGIRRRAASRNR